MPGLRLFPGRRLLGTVLYSEVLFLVNVGLFDSPDVTLNGHPAGWCGGRRQERMLGGRGVDERCDLSVMHAQVQERLRQRRADHLDAGTSE